MRNFRKITRDPRGNRSIQTAHQRQRRIPDREAEIVRGLIWEVRPGTQNHRARQRRSKTPWKESHAPHAPVKCGVLSPASETGFDVNKSAVRMK
jgi:hypothetical protein